MFKLNLTRILKYFKNKYIPIIFIIKKKKCNLIRSVII